MKSDIEQAKRIVLEIVSRSPDGIGKTKLFKTFWLAHLYYFRANPGVLSDWPVIRMPNGPGIDKADRLIGQLVSEGKLTRRNVANGPFTEQQCHPVAGVDSELPQPQRDAIRQAVEFTAELTATELSDYSHEVSRSWNETENGQELNIYLDLMPDDEYTAVTQAMRDAAPAIADIFR